MQISPYLKLPFLPPFQGGEDADFPVVISERAARRLYRHVIQTSQAAIGLLFHCKAGIPDVEFSDAAWRKCESHAANRLRQQYPSRDGRPKYSWDPIAWQQLPAFRMRGGYCK